MTFLSSYLVRWYKSMKLYLLSKKLILQYLISVCVIDMFFYFYKDCLYLHNQSINIRALVFCISPPCFSFTFFLGGGGALMVSFCVNDIRIRYWPGKCKGKQHRLVLSSRKFQLASLTQVWKGSYFWKGVLNR